MSVFNSIKTHLDNSPIVKGTFILTAAGLIAKILGFAYRIILARCITSEELGLYQVVQPILGIIFSLCCVGFQSAVSRYTASDKSDSKIWLMGALIPSMALSIAAALITYSCADLIASRLLLFNNCAPGVRLIALSFPFISLHNCFAGYYYGQKKTAVPALAQITEQCARILSLFIVWYILSGLGVEFNASHAIVGNIAGEAASAACFLVFSKHYSKRNAKSEILRAMKQISSYSLPITVSSLLIHLFQSAEAVLIPAQLIVYGLTSSEALRIYGILSGMALPLIMLPSVFTGSLSVMLIPSVTSASDSLRKTVRRTINFCFVLGIISIVIYVTFMAPLANVMYSEPLAGEFTKILAWLCPFMYLTQAMGSILNGVGKTTSTCIQNTLGIIIRLAALIFAVPHLGIDAYMISLLASKIVVCAIQYIQICRLFRLHRDTHVNRI